MNILPLVSAFILLFALGSYTLVHEYHAAMQEKFHYTAALRIQRRWAKCIQAEEFRKLPGKNEETKEKKESEKKGGEYKSPRDRLNPIPESKLNIAALFTQEKDPLLEQITLNLLHRLYELAPFYHPHMEREILDLILATVKENPSIRSCTDLAKYHPLFYKLAKGTHKVTLFTDQGYPALGDYISLEENENKKAVQFPYASRAVLLAFFGKEEGMVHQLCEVEKGKWEVDHKHHPLTKAELEAFLLQRRKNLSDYEKLLSFSTQKQAPSQYLIQDQPSKIQLKIQK